jgi:hypothetical protein
MIVKTEKMEKKWKKWNASNPINTSGWLTTKRPSGEVKNWLMNVKRIVKMVDHVVYFEFLCFFLCKLNLNHENEF